MIELGWGKRTPDRQYMINILHYFSPDHIIFSKSYIYTWDKLFAGEESEKF
jgi:hypothetical protein